MALGIDLQPVHVELLPPDVVAPAAPDSTKPDQNSDAGKAPEDSQSSATDTSSPGPEPDMRGVNVIVPNRDAILHNYRKRRAVDAAPAPAPVAPSLRVRQRQAPSTTDQADTRLTQPTLIANVAAQAATEGDTATLNRLSAVGAPALHAPVPNTTNDSASQAKLLTHLSTNPQTLETRFSALQQSHLGLQNRVNYLEQQRESIPGPIFHQIIRAHAPGVHDSIMLRAEVARLREVVAKKDEELVSIRKELEGVKEANEKGADTDGEGKQLDIAMEALEKRGEAKGEGEDLVIAMEALEKGDEAKAKDGDE